MKTNCFFDGPEKLDAGEADSISVLCCTALDLAGVPHPTGDYELSGHSLIPDSGRQGVHYPLWSRLQTMRIKRLIFLYMLQIVVVGHHACHPVSRPMPN